MRRLTQEEVIRRFKEVHGNKYDYSLVNYKGISVKVKIKCKNNHVFYQIPKSHINGLGCSYCAGCGKMDSTMFSERAKLIHGNRYDYNLVEYVNSKTKVNILCGIHNKFNQTPEKHLSGQGCPKCAKEENSIKSYKSNDDIISEFIETHGNRYSYSNVVYTGIHNTVEIECKIHGLFSQDANSHKRGAGCPKCAIKSISYKNSISSPGWSVTNWERKAKESNVFDSFKVYIIKCWDENESFYKIGRTFAKVSHRFKQKSSMPYNYDIVKELIFDTAYGAFNKEKELKMLHKEFKHLPSLNFCGMHECFSQIII